jgi:molybdate transport system substrate-binding protein
VRPIAALFALSAVLVFAVPAAQGQNRELIVFAAASLTDAFEIIADDFEWDHPGVSVLFNFGSSSELAAQLVNGAPADVFASANARQMQVAVEAGRIAGQPRTFARNRLVLIVPADNPAAITGLRDLANEGVLLVIAAEGVPVRDYTETMLERLASDSAFGDAYVAAVRANVVSEEQNVRQVAARVALGEADAGIVYVSDVTPDLAADVSALPIPDELNTIAAYPIASIADSAQPELAQAFVDHVLSDAGQNTLESWNFIPIRIPALPPSIALPATNAVLHVGGQVLNPLTLTAADLETQYPAQTVEVIYQSGEQTVTATFTGVPLWQLVNAAQPNLNADVRNDALSMYLVVTGSDGYQAVIAWGEIDPAFGGQPVLLAYAQDGAPITDELGPLRLAVPGDARGGRYVRGVVDISLRDAPPAASE